MIISRRGFIDSYFNADKTLFVGSAGLSTMVLDTNTDKKKGRIPFASNGCFLKDTSLAILTKPKGKFCQIDLEKGKELREWMLPEGNDICDTQVYYYDESTAYFVIERKNKEEKTSIWQFLEYNLEESTHHIVATYELPALLLGFWNGRLLICNEEMDEKGKIYTYAETFKDGRSEKKISFGDVAGIHLIDGKLYTAKNHVDQIQIYTYDETLIRRNVFSINSKDPLCFGDFSVNEKYVAIPFFKGGAKPIRVYDLRTKEVVLEEKVKHFVKVELLEDKLYVCAMDKLIVYPLSLIK